MNQVAPTPVRPTTATADPLAGAEASAAQTMIGRHVDDLDTPVLLVDREVLDSNIAAIASTLRQAGVRWRPHIKSIKAPALVERLLRAGAAGITVAKLGEAETMAAAGFDDILIANQIVGGAKLHRLVELARRTRVIVAVDAEAHVRALGAAARRASVQLDVVIEVEIGLRRCGTQPGATTLALAQLVDHEDGLRFAGLMAWEGHATGIADRADKARAVREAVGLLTATADACRAEGLPVGIVSCGGTGTYQIAAFLPGVTEIQVGGGVFSDRRYRTKLFVDLPCALTVQTTVISRPTPTRIVCDAGRKTMSDDYASPLPIGLDGVRSIRLSAEHVTLELDATTDHPAIGDHVRFVVGYGDTTVHLHDQLVVTSGDLVVEVWPVSARGKTR